MDWIEEQLEEAAALNRLVREDRDCRAALEKICALIVACLKGGGKLLTFGNGGSATDAAHLAEEMTGRYRASRRPLAAICLNADPAALTCIGNDFGFGQIFARQIEALCQPGDVAVAFSTSGQSENILQALDAARQKGGKTIGLLGRGGGAALERCDAALVVPHTESARIQEIHTLALHILCEAVEREFK